MTRHTLCPFDSCAVSDYTIYIVNYIIIILWEDDATTPRQRFLDMGYTVRIKHGPQSLQKSRHFRKLFLDQTNFQRKKYIEENRFINYYY